MKKTQALLAAALLAASHQAGALINDSKFGDPGELFISVWDEAGAKSYYKDLGINMTDFMAGKGCFSGDVSADPNFAGFISASGLVYNIAAVNSLVRDAAGNPVNITQWGYLATSSAGADIFSANWSAIDNTRQKIQGYIGRLNVAPFTNSPGEAAENKSGVFQSTGLGYHGGDWWGASMGRSVGNTEGVPGTAVEFYFVNNANGETSGKQVTKLGAWNFNGGKLSYSGTGTTAICGSGATKITLTVASAGAGKGTITSSPAGISCGTACTADFDKGTAITLTAAPDSASTFKGWSGGSCSGTAACAVTLNEATSVQAEFAVKDVTPTPGIKLDAPSVWKVKQKQTIKWTATLISTKSTVKLSFSKDGGNKFKALKTLPVKRNGFVWKPAKAHITNAGVIRACTKPDPKKQPVVCDDKRVTVQP